MPKPTPLQNGCYYHIYNRGNNRENLFVEARNYHHFLMLYARYIEPIADTFAYCLLKNHFHLLVRIKTNEEQMQASGRSPAALRPLQPSQQFSHLFNAYTKAVNKAYGRTGSLFEHPFERIKVTTNAYLMRLVTYIHRNPQHHGLIDDFREWPYSSYHALCSAQPTRMRRDEVLSWFDGLTQIESAHEISSFGPDLAPLLLDDFG